MLSLYIKIKAYYNIFASNGDPNTLVVIAHLRKNWIVMSLLIRCMANGWFAAKLKILVWDIHNYGGKTLRFIIVSVAPMSMNVMACIYLLYLFRYIEIGIWRIRTGVEEAIEMVILFCACSMNIPSYSKSHSLSVSNSEAKFWIANNDWSVGSSSMEKIDSISSFWILILVIWWIYLIIFAPFFVVGAFFLA